MVFIFESNDKGIARNHKMILIIIGWV